MLGLNKQVCSILTHLFNNNIVTGTWKLISRIPVYASGKNKHIIHILLMLQQKLIFWTKKNCYGTYIDKSQVTTVKGLQRETVIFYCVNLTIWNAFHTKFILILLFVHSTSIYIYAIINLVIVLLFLLYLIWGFSICCLIINLSNRNHMISQSHFNHLCCDSFLFT